MKILTSFFSSLIDFLYPPFCLVCREDTSGEENKFVCSSCMNQIKIIESPFCVRCGRGFPCQDAFINIDEPVCGRCQREDNNIYYDRAFGVGEYDGVLKEIIHLFKYNKREELEKVLGDLLLQKVKRHAGILKPDLLVPVPLHWIRKRTRGFNQSEELGRYISKRLKIPMANLLKRRKNTKPQVGLTELERVRNVRGAFKMRWLARMFATFFNHKSYVIKGKSIVLIDDVVTTGATANECSKVLKKAGAREVKVICLAVVGQRK